MALTEEQRARIERNKEQGRILAAARIAREQAATAAAAAARNSAPPPSSLPKSLQLKQQQQMNQAGCSTAPSTAKTAPMFSNENKPPTPRPPSMAQLPRSQVTASYKFASADRIKVVFRPFHRAVVEALKTLKTRRYDEQERVWSIALDEIKEADAVLKAVKECIVTVEPLPEEVLRTMNVRLEPVPSDLSTVIDPKLVGALFPYQRAGVAFALARSGRVMIADEMGLGKSIQALAVARYYKAEWPLLIVCPSSVKAAWKHQINTFLPYIERIHIIDKTSDALPDARTSNTVIIMSYEQMKLKMKQLEERNYFVIILDECHMLKDSKAQRTKMATTLAKKATRVIMLSGTPALSRPVELFSQIKIVNPGLFPVYQKFAIRYCDGREGRFCFEAKGCTNSEELSAILSRRVMIRRLKNEVLTDLPDKIREVVYLSGSSIDTRMASLQAAKAAFEANSNDSTQHDCLLAYYNETGIVKAAAVCEHILENYFPKDLEQTARRKVLIFAHHRIVLDTIQIEVQKRGLGYIRIDGSTPAKDRGELCNKFQEKADVEVAVLSMAAAGVGITLTAASVVVFAELNWNPGTLMQAEDRAHRVGQKDSVFVQYLVARNTADDVLWPMVQRKLDVLGQVNLSSDTFRDASSTHMEVEGPTAKRMRPIVE